MNVMKLPANEYEDELRERLRRVNAPPSLADAVMSRVSAEPRRVLGFPRRHVSLGRIAAMLLLTALLIGLGAAGMAHKRAAERTRAERDFARSQELTSRALEPVRQHLRRAGIAFDE